MTFPLRDLELFKAPSSIKSPAIPDLLAKRLSSSVVERTPLVTIETPAVMLELNKESSSVKPDVSLHDKLIPVGGEALTSDPALL